MKSNVQGHKKEKLDPEIINHISKKCFLYYSSKGNFEERKEEWKKCIRKIDEQSSVIKKKRKNKACSN